MDYGRRTVARAFMQILWPAFMWAGVMVGVLFSVVDPLSIELVHEYLNESRQAAYTLGFVFCWVLIAAACMTTWFLASR